MDIYPKCDSSLNRNALETFVNLLPRSSQLNAKIRSIGIFSWSRIFRRKSRFATLQKLLQVKFSASVASERADWLPPRPHRRHYQDRVSHLVRRLRPGRSFAAARCHLSPPPARRIRNPSQPKASFFGDGQDEFSKLFWLPLCAFGLLRFRIAVFLFTHPAVERGRAANRNQLLDGSPDGLAVLQQSLPLVVSGVDLLRKAIPQNLVLAFQKLNVLGKFAVGRRGNSSQKWVKYLGH